MFTELFHSLASFAFLIAVQLKAKSPFSLLVCGFDEGSWAMLQAFWSHDKTYPQTNSCTALPVLDLAMHPTLHLGNQRK